MNGDTEEASSINTNYSMALGLLPSHLPINKLLLYTGQNKHWSKNGDTSSININYSMASIKVFTVIPLPSSQSTTFSHNNSQLFSLYHLSTYQLWYINFAEHHSYLVFHICMCLWQMWGHFSCLDEWTDCLCFCKCHPYSQMSVLRNR